MTEKPNKMPEGEPVPAYLVQMPPVPEDMQSDLRFFWQILVCYRRLLIASTVFFTVVALAYALLAQPVYRAQVLVSPVNMSDRQSGLGALAGQFGGIASLMGVSLDGDESKERAIAVLKSRAFTDQMMDELNMLPVLFEDRWDPEGQAWREGWRFEEPTRADAFRKFDRDVRRLTEDNLTGLITLSIDLHDRFLAAEWANYVVDRANSHLRQNAIDEANRNISFLEAELEKSGYLELRQAIFGLIQQQVELAMIANTQEEFAFKIIDPAVAPDEDDEYWPMRAAIVVFGLFFGAIVGIVLAILANAVWPERMHRLAPQ